MITPEQERRAQMNATLEGNAFALANLESELLGRALTLLPQRRNDDGVVPHNEQSAQLSPDAIEAVTALTSVSRSLSDRLNATIINAR